MWKTTQLKTTLPVVTTLNSDFIYFFNFAARTGSIEIMSAELSSQKLALVRGLSQLSSNQRFEWLCLDAFPSCVCRRCRLVNRSDDVCDCDSEPSRKKNAHTNCYSIVEKWSRLLQFPVPFSYPHGACVSPFYGQVLVVVYKCLSIHPSLQGDLCIIFYVSASHRYGSDPLTKNQQTVWNFAVCVYKC